MAVVETISTPTHAYYKKKAKWVIRQRIRTMYDQLEAMDIDPERLTNWALENNSADFLASEAMRLHRLFPETDA